MKSGIFAVLVSLREVSFWETISPKWTGRESGMGVGWGRRVGDERGFWRAGRAAVVQFWRSAAPQSRDTPAEPSFWKRDVRRAARRVALRGGGARAQNETDGFPSPAVAS
jgi:hypothetical protein